MHGVLKHWASSSLLKMETVPLAALWKPPVFGSAFLAGSAQEAFYLPLSSTFCVETLSAG